MDRIAKHLMEVIDLDKFEKKKTEVIIHFIEPRPVPDYESLEVSTGREARFSAEVLASDGACHFGYKDFVENRSAQTFRTVAFEFDSKDVSVVETRKKTDP